METPTSEPTVSDQNTIVEVIIGRTKDPVYVCTRFNQQILHRLGKFDPKKQAYKRGKGPETYTSGGLIFRDGNGDILFSIPVNEIGLVHDNILDHFNFKPCEKYPEGKLAKVQKLIGAIVLEIPELLVA